MAPWLGSPWNRHLSGQIAWRGQIDKDQLGDRIRIDSDLLGLTSSLPAPLTKGAVQPLPLVFIGLPTPEGRQNEIRLGKTVAAIWRTATPGKFVRGEVRFGENAMIPNEPGLRIAGNGHGLDLSGWMGMLKNGDGEETLPLSSINLGISAFDLMGRRFHDINLQGRNRNGLFRTQISGREVNGVVTFRAAGDQPARISAQFRQLTIPEAVTAGSGVAASNLKGTDFPILDLSVEDFRLQSRAMGRLDVTARGAAQGLVIENLELAHPDSVFRMSGLWREAGLSETRAELNLKVVDVGRFLARFGYADTVKRGSAEIQGNATWEGSPADFSVDSLAGQLAFKAREGQFLKVEPGVAKLLGVLSLQALPRRLSFDFRDIFNEGYAFDEMSATLRIARGVVYSDDFRMRGPAAKVNMSGLADLNQESVQLRLKVIPKLSEGVAVAGALIAGPLAGVGALAAQKLLRDPLEEAISREYTVIGAWQAPDVTRVPKTSFKSETQGTDP